MKTPLQSVIAAMFAAAWITAPATSAAEPLPESTAGEKRIEQLKQDFLKLKFGMFLHYNMATYTGEQWVVGYPDPSTFNPGGPIDTDQWADAAKAAGMKYAVLTAKHVSGFCLWDSKHTTYDVQAGKDRRGRRQGAGRGRQAPRRRSMIFSTAIRTWQTSPPTFLRPINTPMPGCGVPWRESDLRFARSKHPSRRAA